MNDTTRKLLLRCIRVLVQPAARFCLRRSIGIQDFIEIAKEVFVEAATQELKQKESKITVSRISVMTGLRRREVVRFLDEKYESDSDGSTFTKIIGQWLHDKKYSTKSQSPRVLSYEGDDNEFSQLVQSVSKDIKPGTVLSHLKDLDAIEYTKKGVRLIESAYVPKNNPQEGFHILSLDMEDLTSAVEENIYEDPQVPNLHATTEYDNIPHDAVPAIRSWLLDEGISFHRRVRKFLSQYDNDINDKETSQTETFRVVCGSFSRIAEQVSDGDVDNGP